MTEALNDILLMRNEMMLIIIMVVLLIMKVADNGKSNGFWIGAVNAMLVVNCIVGWFPMQEGLLFGGVYKSFALGTFGKNILNSGVLLISLVSTQWLRNCRHVVEFYLLLLSSLLGMFFMISSGNLLLFYLALELSTIPVAALANFSFEERRSSEAAMKLILSSAFASSILLMGISFLYGAGGTINFEILTVIMNNSPLMIMGFVLIFVGITFKLSIVPFHLWTADVYEGSPIPITIFLSVISKGAMVFVFAFLLYHVFGALAGSWYLLLYILSMITMLTGNIFALRQNNLKRLLAFSSITQIGYILVGISGSSVEGLSSVVYFIIVYLFSNIAAFGVIAQVANKSGSEDISAMKGLAKSNPFLAWTMAIALFSLAGIPPTAGFFGKIFLLKAGAGKGDLFLIAFASINMIIALAYYLRIIKAMFMEEPETKLPKISTDLSFRVAAYICLAGIILTGFSGWLLTYIGELGLGL